MPRIGRGVFTYKKLCRRFGDDFQGRLMYQMLNKAGLLGLTPGQSPFALPRPVVSTTPILPKEIADAKFKLKEEIKSRLIVRALQSQQ